MKTILKNSILVIFIIAHLSSCENGEWEFSDYKYSALYFPYQTPVRTIELGDDYVIDNSKDNLLQFSIGVTLAGLYKNNKDRLVSYMIDPLLVNNLFIDNGDTLKIMPDNYYQILGEKGKFTIPKNNISGSIKFQLNDAFLNDAFSHTKRYVIPIRILSADIDSILRGKSNLDFPDRRIGSQWLVEPKDYTLFVVKYINEYHGKYLLRGNDTLKTNTNNLIETIVYRKKFIEDNEVVSLSTLGRNKVLYNSKVRKSTATGLTTNFSFHLTFNSTGECVLSNVSGPVSNLSGYGKFLKNGDEWGGRDRNMIVLSYNYSYINTLNVVENHHVKDTLVIRDRDIRLETFKPLIK